MVRTVDCVLVQDAGPRVVAFAMHNKRGIRAVDVPGGLPSVEASVHRLVPTGVLVDAVLDKHTLYASLGIIELTEVEADMHHMHKELVGVVLAVASRRFELEASGCAYWWSLLLRWHASLIGMGHPLPATGL